VRRSGGVMSRPSSRVCFSGVSCVVGFALAVVLGWFGLPNARAEAASDPLYLVKKNQANAVIVVQPVIKKRQVALDEFTFPGNRNVPPRQWAQTLQTYIKRITGAQLPIVENKAEVDGLAIHVGLTEFVAGLKLPFDKHDRDAIFLKRVGDNIVLVGVDDWGSEIAVYDFLERVCDVRWYQPGELWEIVPETDTLAVGNLDVVEEPSFKSRMFSGVMATGMPVDVWKECRTWLKRNRIRMRYTFHHNMAKIITPSKYGKTNPEYFPYVSGKRVVPKNDGLAWRGSQPCYTAPGVVKASAEAAREYFDQYPNAACFSLGVNDMGGYCECTDCLKANKDGGVDKLTGKLNYSPVYFSFLNKVCEELSKTHPDKKIGCMAYASGTSVPPPFDLHPNIVGYIQPNDYSRWHFNKELRDWFTAQLEAWSSKFKVFGLYAWRHGRTVYIPKLQLKSFDEYLKTGYKYGARGYYGEEYPNWGVDTPRTYIAARLLWDVNRDVDSLLDDFCAKAFGNAAIPMKAFYHLLEKTWNEHKQYDAPPMGEYMYGGRREQLSVFTPAIIEQGMACLNDALRSAKDEKVRQRILQVKKSFRLTELYALREFIYRNMDVPRTLTAENFAEVIGKLNSMHHLTNTIRALIYSEYQNDFYSWYGGLILARQYRTSRPLMTDMEQYYYDVSAEIVSSLVKERMRASEQQSKAEVTAALIDRLKDITKHMSPSRDEEPKGLAKFPMAVEPAWSIMEERLSHYLDATAVIAKMDEPPTLDGFADAEEWRGTDVLDFPHQIGSGKNYGVVIKDGTKARLGYDDNALYITYICDEDTANLITRYTAHDSAVWRDDCLDFVLLPPNVANDKFYHFIINSLGVRFDSRGNDDKKWNADMRIAVGKDRPKDTWTVEIAIPWKTLGRKPISGEIWRGQFGRANFTGIGGGPQDLALSGWAPSKSGFNNADSLGILLFE